MFEKFVVNLVFKSRSFFNLLDPDPNTFSTGTDPMPYIPGFVTLAVMLWMLDMIRGLPAAGVRGPASQAFILRSEQLRGQGHQGDLHGGG